MIISQKDLSRLRSLAWKQVEIARSEKMQRIVRDWQDNCLFRKNARPMVTIELWTFEDEIIPPLMQCEGEAARKLERKLLSNIVNHTLFDDDTIVKDYMPFYYSAPFTPFGLKVNVEHIKSDENSLGHHFVEQISDLEADFHKLNSSTFSLTPKAETLQEISLYNELLGDILPGKIEAFSLVAVPTQDVVHIMGMENMFYAMYDYPELFHRMMDMLSDDYIAYFHALSQNGYLGATTSAQRVCQGSYCFTDQLPDKKDAYSSRDIWGYLDSQESSGLSPEMYAEFIFPYYRKIMAQMGRVSYGCCEAVDPIWDNCISQVKNLGKVSISPWCNEEVMGERLRGRDVTYLRKPTPNLIGLTSQLDEDAVRTHFRKTVQAARGCTLEIVQRDVYRICNTPDKVRRYVELIRQECEHHQR
ncbi:MAG: hypothetical protein ACI4P4_03920 [Faecousia sp.]